MGKTYFEDKVFTKEQLYLPPITDEVAEADERIILDMLSLMNARRQMPSAIKVTEEFVIIPSFRHRWTYTIYPLEQPIKEI